MSPCVPHMGLKYLNLLDSSVSLQILVTLTALIKPLLPNFLGRAVILNLISHKYLFSPWGPKQSANQPGKRAINVDKSLKFWGKRANLSAFCTFVRFVLVWICRFSLPLGVWKGFRFCDCGTPWTFLLPFFNAMDIGKKILAKFWEKLHLGPSK